MAGTVQTARAVGARTLFIPASYGRLCRNKFGHRLVSVPSLKGRCSTEVEHSDMT